MAITTTRARAAHSLTGALSAGLLALTLGVQGSAHASVSPTPTKTAGLSGIAVYDLTVLDSGRVILVGNYTKIGALVRTDVGALLPTGKPDPGFEASTNGDVRAVAASEDGSRIFIGGTFTEVNGEPRQNLAAIDAVTGALVPDWQADTTGTVPMVKSLAVHDDRLYVAGKFTGIDGTAKQKLAALNVTTGNLVTWNTGINGNVNEVRVSPDGATVWVGGSFTRIKGVDRRYFAAIDAVSGLATSFDRGADGGYVITVAVSGDGSTVYASTENNTIFAYEPCRVQRPALDQEAGWQHPRDRDLADRDLRRRALRRHDPVPDQPRPLHGCPDGLGPESHRYQERDLVPGHPRQQLARRRAVHPLRRGAAAALRAVRGNADPVTSAGGLPARRSPAATAHPLRPTRYRPSSLPTPLVRRTA